MILKTLRALCGCAALLAGSAQAAQTPAPLNFGIISTESSTAIMARWNPILEDLSKTLGVPVKPFFATDYAGIIEGMRFKKVQIAYYGNESAIEAVDRANGEVFASSIGKDGSIGYYSVVVAAKDGPIKSVQDVLARGKDLSYGAGDPNSTSGYAVPNYYLWSANKVDPRTFFKNVRAANHEANLLAVVNKQVDLAVCNTTTLERYEKATGRKVDDVVNVIWKSPLIPSSPLVWRTDLPAAQKDKIRAFFVNYGKTGEEKARLQAAGMGGFNASNNDQLIPIRQIDLAGRREKLQADATLSASQKQQQIAAIDAKLAKLNARLANLKTDH